MKTFEVDENIVVYAFRYALGRKTGAVLDVVETLIHLWPELAEYTQGKIKKEIQTEIDRGWAGAKCDVRQWERILDL